jgi:signal transduction histidine kinase
MLELVFSFLAGAGVVIILAIIIFWTRKSAPAATRKDQKSWQLEELSRLTGQIAHEIKNPLSTIKVNLKLISEDLQSLDINNSAPANTQAIADKAGRAIRKINVIQKETQRLEEILHGFLRYADQSIPQLEKIDINEILSDMTDFYSPQAQNQNIKIRQHFCDEPLVCKVDVNMLKQVILNLFINAQQAMETGGDLMIKTAKENDDAVIIISDTGCGIEQSRLSQIFDAYRSSRPNGCGLGLPTAKKIIEAHNGKITVRSEVDKGSMFTIKLPLLQ